MPSPTAEQLGSKALKELMTVGQITATPRVLASDGDPLPPPDTPFHIRDSSQREQLGRRLGVKASKAMKERAAIMNGTPRSSNSMPPPSWTPRAAAGNLTPAAKRLLERTVGGSVAGNRRADAMDQTAAWQARGTRDLSKVSWTPTPKR
jgi:protein DGCR14